MRIPLFSVFAFGFIGFSAHAGNIKIPVVASYQNLDNENVWKNIDQDEVPLFAIQMREIQTPSRATGDVFLQNDRMIVCYQSCSKAQPHLQIVNGVVQLKDLNASKFRYKVQREEAWKALKILNVYYWTNQLFDYLETFGYKPSRRLKVIVDRNISDPIEGYQLKNNALFTEFEWSLNFLPVKNSMIHKQMGLDVHTPALDPGVIMHECTHSVFQELVGTIINPSLFGLHEAFADYFSMAVLNTRKAGVVFGSGKGFRSTLDDSAKEIEIYSPGLESHDVGNIVNTALQHIRNIIPQKRFADFVVLETVKELGKDPYIQATQVQAAHMKTLTKVAISQGQQVSPEIMTAVGNVWKGYNIQSPAPAPLIPKEFFKKHKSVSGFFEVASVTEFPAAAVADWKMPARSVIRSGILNISNGPNMQAEDPEYPTDTKVVLAEVEGGSVTTPIYLHLSRQGLLGAYDYTGQLITPKNPEQVDIFEKTIQLNQTLTFLIDLSNRSVSRGEIIASLFDDALIESDLQKDTKRFYRVKNKHITRSMVNMSSAGNIEVIKRSAQIDTAGVGKFASVLGDGILWDAEYIGVYTVKASQVPQLKTNEIFPGEVVLGFEMRTQTGVFSKIIISDFDGDPKSVVLGERK